MFLECNSKRSDGLHSIFVDQYINNSRNLVIRKTPLFGWLVFHCRYVLYCNFYANLIETDNVYYD